eukprot:4263-Eustigmatos_ZCMA.PRE.1
MRTEAHACTCLSLRDVPGKVGNGVSDVVVGHGQDGKLRDRPILAHDTTRTLVDRGKIRIHVTLQWHITEPQSNAEIRLAPACRRAHAIQRRT